MTRHPQVELADFPFTVDEGLEQLIPLLWEHDMPTSSSCIGDTDEPGYVGFLMPEAAKLFEELVAPIVNWYDDDEEWFAEIYFDAESVPQLVAILSAL